MKEGLIFLTGLAAGFGIGYVFFKSKYQKEIEEDIEELRQYYKEKVEKEDEKKVKEKIADVLKGDESALNSLRGYVDDDKFKEIEHIYAENEHPEDDDSDIDEDYRFGEMINSEKTGKGILVINEEHFGDIKKYDKQTLYYYTYDDTVTDDCENIIDDVKSQIGEALEVHNFKFNDERAIYVRNNDLDCDYEIIKVVGSFSNSMV